MSQATAIETRIVPFYGDQLQAVKDERGVWAWLTPMCEALGLDETAQARRLRRQAWSSTAMMAGEAGIHGVRERVCIALKSVPMWLATVQVSRVRPELREKLARYQCEAADVLARAFVSEIAPAPVAPVPDWAAALSQRLDRLEWGFLAHALKSVDERLSGIEDRIGCLAGEMEDVHEETVKIRRRQAASGRGNAGLSRRDRRARPKPAPALLDRAGVTQLLLGMPVRAVRRKH